MGVENVVELLPIPAGYNILVNNKGRIFTETVPEGFVNPHKGFGVDNYDPDAVLIKAGNFMNPIRKLMEFLSEVFRIFSEGFIIHLAFESALGKYGSTSVTITEYGE